MNPGFSPFNSIISLYWRFNHAGVREARKPIKEGHGITMPFFIGLENE